jgi:protein-tyrosine phosphatase
MTAVASEPAKIAFVDTGNTGRSVTAEALANAVIAERKLPILVISRAVDLNPYNVVPEPNAVALLQSKGIDVSAHRAAQLTARDVRHSDLLFVMTTKHKNTVQEQFPDAKGKVFTISEYATGVSTDVVDAYGQPMPVYEQVFAQISGYLPTVLDKVSRSVPAK